MKCKMGRESNSQIAICSVHWMEWKKFSMNIKYYNGESSGPAIYKFMDSWVIFQSKGEQLGGYISE